AVGGVGVGAARLDGRPAWRVELQLEERRAGMPPDVPGRAGVRAVVDVRVAVRRAGHLRADVAATGVRRGLVVAQRHPEPERGAQLEVIGATGAVLPGLR